MTHLSKMKALIDRAESGDKQAQFNLGEQYESGKNLPQSSEEAARYYKLAADEGHKQAIFKMAQLYYENRGVEPNDALAFAYADEAVRRGCDGAQGYLATYYAEGRGVEQDFAKAIEYLDRLVRYRKDIWAMLVLAGFHAEGYGVPRNEAESRRYLIMAADHDDRGTMEKLGPLLAKGLEGYEVDHRRAYLYLGKTMNWTDWYERKPPVDVYETLLDRETWVSCNGEIASWHEANSHYTQSPFRDPH